MAYPSLLGLQSSLCFAPLRCRPGSGEDGRHAVAHGRKDRAAALPDHGLEYFVVPASARRMACSSSCHRRVEPSMSVKRNVMVSDESSTREFSLPTDATTTAVADQSGARAFVLGIT